jgi:hypothetical protein
MFFNVSGYITNIYDNKIKIKVDDIKKINTIMNKLYKNSRDYSILTINTKFVECNITSIKWNDMRDLLHRHVNIHCKTKYFSYRESSISDENIFKKGYTIYAINLNNN